MVPISLTTLLVAILFVSAAKRERGRKNQANRNVEPVCKAVKKAHYFNVPLIPMTADLWVGIATNHNRQALEILKPLKGSLFLPYTLLSSAQKEMKLFSENKRYYGATALTYQMQSLNALLNLTITWDATYKEVAKHLSAALTSLVLAAEMRQPLPNKESQLAALKLVDEEENQPQTANEAVKLADEVLARISTNLPKINMPPPLHIS